MDKKPRYAKAHSQRVADEYIRLGWTLQYEFRVLEADEPYEYFFEWLQESDPESIDWPEFRERLNQNGRTV